MSRINYVSVLNNYYQSQGFPPYTWSIYDTSPWTIVKKPLSLSRICLLSSGGISLKSQHPFDPFARDDFSYREIPADAGAGDFVINYAYNDHSDADRDINCLFPIERFRELAEEKYIASLSPINFTMGMGRLYKRSHLQNVVVPDLVNKLRQYSTDALFLVPS